MIVRARAVVTMDGPVIENGAVRVRGSQIIEVSTFPELSSGGEEVIDLGDRILLPGLINAHCHLDYTCLRGKIPPPQSFTDWIRAINAEKAKLSPQDYVVSINTGFVEAKQFGTTSMANLTAFPELIAQVKNRIRTWWFAELIDVRKSMENSTALSRQVSRPNGIDDAVEKLTAAYHRGLAPHAPFTASANLYRCCEQTARRENILLTTHLAESREEMQMFRDADGPLYHFLRGLGRDMNDCGGTTPLQAFLRNLQIWPGESSISLAMTPGWIIAHLNDLNETDFDLLAKIPQKFSIVHCPRSHAYFRHNDFQFERLNNLGFNVCLGTDSLASNYDLSLFAEMRMFHDRFHVEPKKVLEMVTVNAARGLEMENLIGKVKKNLLADMIAVPFMGSGEPHETILNFVGQVPWIMLHGESNGTP